MRLLDAEALIYDNVAELVDFQNESSIPPYAILSHTWEQEEILFHDIPLGPQHEIQPTSVSIRALGRQQVPHGLWTYTARREEHDYQISDENSSDTDSSETSATLSHGDQFGSTTLAGNRSGRAGNFSIELLSPHVKAGWNKVLNACLQTLRDGLIYIWIDTCCIDKSSSAELSECINSMFRWYQEAKVCYVYLRDCQWSSEIIKSPTDADMKSASRLCSEFDDSDQVQPILKIASQVAAIRNCICDCRWFSRGWTLQELIAPMKLVFFDQDWRWIVERSLIRHILEDITGIHGAVLGGLTGLSHPSHYSVAQRMFWASSRQTTRKEDEAYCLLGLFGINMPLLYGEGEQAFQRLQQEIIRTSTDQSILAWELLPDDYYAPGLPLSTLARSPANFWDKAQHIVIPTRHRQKNNSGFRFTNEGIEIQLALDAYRIRNKYSTIIAVLDCIMKGSQTRIGVWLRIQVTELVQRLNSGQRLEATFAAEWMSEADHRLVEIPYFEPFAMDYYNHPLLIPAASQQSSFAEITPQTVHIEIGHAYTSGKQILKQSIWELVEAHPPYQWQKNRGTMILPVRKKSFVALAIQHWDYKRRFIIIIGTASTTAQTRLPPRHGNGLCRYWILPTLKPEPGRLSMENHQQYLHILCDRAASFELEDYYENSTKREDSSKVLRLASGEHVSARITPLLPGRVLRMEFIFERHDKVENPTGEQDYFHIDRLLQPLRYPVPQILVNGDSCFEMH